MHKLIQRLYVVQVTGNPFSTLQTFAVLLSVPYQNEGNL